MIAERNGMRQHDFCTQQPAWRKRTAQNGELWQRSAKKTQSNETEKINTGNTYVSEPQVASSPLEERVPSEACVFQYLVQHRDDNRTWQYSRPWMEKPPRLLLTLVSWWCDATLIGWEKRTSCCQMEPRGAVPGGASRAWRDAGTSSLESELFSSRRRSASEELVGTCRPQCYIANPHELECRPEHWDWDANPSHWRPPVDCWGTNSRQEHDTW